MNAVAYAVILGLMLPLSWFTCEWLRHFWFLWFITDQTYPVFFRLVYGASLVDWGLYFAVFFVAGVAVASPVLKQRPALWAAGFGVAYALMCVLFFPIWVPPFRETFVTIWACGLYLVPPVGATLGALFVRAVVGHGSPSVGT